MKGELSENELRYKAEAYCSSMERCVTDVEAKLSQNVSCLFLLSYNVLQIILHGCSLIIGIYDIM